MKFERILMLLPLILMNACSSSVDEIKIGSYSFCVPRENIDLYVENIDNKLDQGFDTGGPQVVFTWRPEVVQENVSGFRKRHGNNDEFISTLKVSVYAPNKNKINFIQGAESVRDVLTLSGSFEGAVVKYDDAGDYYRVSRRVEYPVKWEVLTIKPDRNAKLPERKDQVWLGSCHHSEDGSAGCYFDRTYNDLFLNIRVGGDNFHLRSEIVAFVKGEIDFWKSLCG